jgi:hypothetical protein
MKTHFEAHITLNVLTSAASITEKQSVKLSVSLYRTIKDMLFKNPLLYHRNKKKSHHLTLSEATFLKFISSHPAFPRPNLILSSYPYLTFH